MISFLFVVSTSCHQHPCLVEIEEVDLLIWRTARLMGRYFPFPRLVAFLYFC